MHACATHTPTTMFKSSFLYFVFFSVQDVSFFVIASDRKLFWHSGGRLAACGKTFRDIF